MRTVGTRRQRWRVGLPVMLAMLGFGSGGVLRGQAQLLDPSAGGPSAGVPAAIETKADRLNYDRANGIVEAIGHVVITRGDVVLTADYVRVDANTEEAEAFGDVTLTRGDDVWTGPSLNYNFRTGAGISAGMEASAKPFFVRAETSERDAKGAFILHNAWVTTCDPDTQRVNYHVTAKRLELLPGDYLKARNAVWWFGPVPVMVAPYWYRDLAGDYGWRFVPGESNRMGLFLLSSYKYRISPGMTGRTHLDFRAERGVAFGQDLKWNTGGNRHVGDLRVYYADDDKPVDEDDDAVADDLDNERYRVRYQDLFVLSPRDLVRARVHYLSDTDVLEDFFDEEFRVERQPDNYLDFNHREDNYSLNVVARARLNDFYDNVNRLPEATLEIYRLPILDGSIYYESQSSLGFMEKVFRETSAREDYDSLRFDTRHTIYRPDKLFGFLTVVPRVGVRGTYYSKTKADSEVVTVTTVTNVTISANGATNTVVSSASNTVTRTVEGGADTRVALELGFETSYKAFGIYDTPFGPRRHVVEPYANYTLVPEPNITPDQLYQFDSVDALDEQHTVRLGVRNKWQEKREAGPHDIVDLDLYTIVNLSTEGDEDAIENLFWDAELRLVDGLFIDFDGSWDVPESELSTFNAWVISRLSPSVRISADYRYRVNDSSLVYGDITLFPQRKWSLNAYGRHEFEEGQTEEFGGYIQHIFDCVGLRVGGSFLPGYTRSDGTQRDDDYRLMLEFWLTAFPEHGVGAGDRR